jgi:hypothetical protein
MTVNFLSDVVESAKNVGVVLTSASAVAYASGYLALRSRAHALGADPGFTLVDQAYVFAGFRFGLIMLVALLVVWPLLVLVAASAKWAASMMKPGPRRFFELLGVVALAVLTLAGFRTLFLEGALLADDPARRTALERMLYAGVLGAGRVGVVVVLASTATAAMTLLWTRGRYAQTGADNSLTMALGVIAALQIALLPVQYGVFFADRTVRVLQRSPADGAGGSSIAWLLDRGADRASLLERRPQGGFAIVTVRVEDLDGMAVTGTTSLADIVKSGEVP